MSRDFVNHKKGVARDGRDRKSVILIALLFDCQFLMVMRNFLHVWEKVLNSKLSHRLYS